MDLYKILLGLVCFFGSFGFLIREFVNNKKPIGSFRIHMLGSLIILIVLGIWIITSEIIKFVS